MELKAKLEKLKDYLKNKKLLIAFSGGADSSLIAFIANEISKKPLAVTIDNGVMPADFIGNAEDIAKKIGIKHLVVKEDFLEDKAFQSNPPNRCYVCKNKMYSKLVDIAKDEFEVVDGTNITDLLEDRPGIMVNYDKNIKSPLVIAGFTSEDVKKALEHLKIDYSKSTTCMATRLDRNSEITSKKINRIKYAESLLKGISGSEIVRVRDQDDIALIEIENVGQILKPGIIKHIDSELKAVGFKRVTVDIGEYGKSNKDLVIYKPCKDEKHKIMFETELPYTININATCEQLKKIGDVKCSKEMGIVMLEIEDRNVTIFKTGKMVARRVINKEDAEKLITQVLPGIRRNI